MLFLLRVKGTGEQRETHTEESDMTCNHKMSTDIYLMKVSNRTALPNTEDAI